MNRALLAVGGVAIVVLGGLVVYRATRPVDHADAGYQALMAGRNHEAIDELRLAVKQEPGLAPAHYDLGSAYENVGWIEQAVPELEKAVELAPANPTYREGLAQTKRTLGFRAHSEGQWAEAAKLYQRALYFAPNDATTLYNLALVLQRLGRHDESRRALARSNELDPEHPHKLPGGS